MALKLSSVLSTNCDSAERQSPWGLAICDRHPLRARSDHFRCLYTR